MKEQDFGSITKEQDLGYKDVRPSAIDRRPKEGDGYAIEGWGLLNKH